MAKFDEVYRYYDKYEETPITGEAHLLTGGSPSYYLRHHPKEPITALEVDGTPFTESESLPIAAGYFYVDYSMGGVYHNAGDSGTASVDYTTDGTIVWADHINMLGSALKLSRFLVGEPEVRSNPANPPSEAIYVRGDTIKYADTITFQTFTAFAQTTLGVTADTIINFSDMADHTDPSAQNVQLTIDLAGYATYKTDESIAFDLTAGDLNTIYIRVLQAGGHANITVEVGL